MIDRLATAWDQLQARERIAVASLVLVFIPVGLAFLVALPMLDTRENALRQRSEAASLYQWVLARDADWQSLAALGTVAASQVAPVGIAGIEKALTVSGLRDSVSSLENGQDGRVRVQLEGAPFAEFARFLERIAPELGYSIATLRISPATTAGNIVARLELQP
jgi:type II secretory pathway component PulM